MVHRLPSVCQRHAFSPRQCRLRLLLLQVPLLLWLLCPVQAQQSLPATLSYQGKLRDADGLNLNSTVALQLRLFTSVTGGTVLWSETHPSVAVTRGQFSVTLGALSSFADAGVIFDRLYYLEVQVNTEVLSPRQPLSSVAYAMRAGGVADASITSAMIQPGAVTASSLADGAVTGGKLADGAVTGAKIAGAPADVGKVLALDANGNAIWSTPVAPGFAWVRVTATSATAAANTGYLADNLAPVSITLPASGGLTPGDIIRISGVGAGGWRVVPGGGQSFILGNSAAVEPVGTTWNACASPRNWQGLASSADGHKLIAAAYSGQLYTSTDAGATWAARDSVRDWTVVASSADGGKLVACAWQGQLYTSTDSGATWTARESNRNWRGVASSADGNNLVASAGNDFLYTSSDAGVTWTARMTDSPRQWNQVASSADGSKLVACVLGGQLYTSTDAGATWTARENNRSWRSVASSTDGAKLVACADGGTGGCIYTSTDSGMTWTPRDSDRGWWSVTSSADGSRLAACVNFGGAIYTSSDSGVTWLGGLAKSFWTIVASSADGNRLMAGDYGGQLHASASSSVSTTPLAGSQYEQAELQYLGNNQFLVVTQSGAGASAQASWVRVTGASATAAANTGYIVTGSNQASIALPSSDTLKPGDTIRITGVGTGGWQVVPGNGQSILQCEPAGTTWTVRKDDRARPWLSIACSADGRRLVACSEATDRAVTPTNPIPYNGEIYTSPDLGVTWTPRFSTAHASWADIACSANGNRLIVCNNDEYGAVYSSIEFGANWQALTPVPVQPLSDFWTGVASTASGTTLFAYRYMIHQTNVTGTPMSTLYSSVDSGATWETKLITGKICDLSCSADGTRLVAIIQKKLSQLSLQEGSYICTSDDGGTTWTERSDKRTWYSLACSADGRKLIAGVGFFTTEANKGHICTSDDFGLTWVEHMTDSDRNWISVASSADGTKLAAAEYGGMIYTSGDGGVTWIPRLTDRGRNWISVDSSADGNTLAACEYGGMVYTSDSTVLTTAPVSGRQYEQTELQYTGNGQFIILKTSGSGAGGLNTTPASLGTLNNVDINGGSIDGTPIGATTPAAATVTDLTVTGALTVTSGSPGAGKVLTSDASGHATWSVVPATGGTGGFTWVRVTGTTAVASANTGYMVDNNSLVDVTLPPTAGLNAGDIVRVSGAGPGGWRVSARDDQAILTSNRGVGGGGTTEWTACESDRFWAGIVGSANGQKLLACASGGTLHTSSDAGATWVARETTRTWLSVASSADGTHLVACGDDYSLGNADLDGQGKVFTSADSGATWTARIIPGSHRRWWSTACSADGTIMMAGEYGSEPDNYNTLYGGRIYISRDAGATWSTNMPVSTSIWNGLACSADGSKMVAAAWGNGMIYTSADAGVTWTPRPAAGVAGWYNVVCSADGQKIMAGSWGVLTTSNDGGETWVKRNPAGALVSCWYGITCSTDGSRLVAADWGGYIHISNDGGATWTAAMTDKARDWSGVTCSADGSKLAACVSGGQIYTSTRSDIVTTLTGNQYELAELQYLGNGQFISIGKGGAGGDAITSNQTLVAGKTLDVSAGTLKLADGQISGAKIADYSLLGIKLAYGTVTADKLAALSSVTINGGTINGTTIGADTAAAATVTDLTVNGALAITSGNPGAGKVLTSDATGNASWSAAAGGGTGFNWVRVTDTSAIAAANTGYLADNLAPVSITLPASGSLVPGDAIRISGVGAGGWQAVPGSGQNFILGNRADVEPVGTTWIPRDSMRAWNALASSADGSKLAAAVYEGQIFTSTDSGASWSAREDSRNWQGLASSADGRKLVACVWQGQIYTSADSGSTWTVREENRNWRGVASSADGTKLVACTGWNGYLYTSTDSGETWTPRMTDTGREWYRVASSADGSKLFACVLGGQLYTSTDSGATWTARENDRNWRSVASSTDGTKLVACADGGVGGCIYTSADSGETWTPRESDRVWWGVTSSADGNKLAACVGFGGALFTSADAGATWTERPSKSAWSSVVISADGNKLLAGDYGGQLYTSTSGNFSTAPVTGGQYEQVELQYHGNGQFLVLRPGSGTVNTAGTGATPPQIHVANTDVTAAKANTRYVADSAVVPVRLTLPNSASLVVGDTIRISGVGTGGWQAVTGSGQSLLLGPGTVAPGTIWTAHATVGSWNDIASSADGRKLVACGSGLYTSTDYGNTWLLREGVSASIVASSADGTHLAACEFGGLIYTSSDSGMTWTPRESARNWTSIASSADGSKLVACANITSWIGSVGTGGWIGTSSDFGVSWTACDNGNRNWRNVASSADGTNLAACESGGFIYTSSDSGSTWTPREGVRYWNSIACSADGSKLVACVNAGKLYRSTDYGATWAECDNNIRQWCRVASSADGTKLLACVGRDGGRLYTSTDSGGTWTTRLTDANRKWSGLAISADGSRLAACAENDFIYTSHGSTATSAIGDQYQQAILQYLGGGQFLLQQTQSTGVQVVTGGLTVVSPLAITSSDPGAGKVLTSDASGNATWKGNPGVTWVQVTSAYLATASANTGYLANNTGHGPVNLQLPESASLATGDIIRISGVGQGPWKVLGAYGQKFLQDGNYVVADNSWAAKELSADDVASSADGNKLVACKYNGSILISVNSGYNWTAVVSTGIKGWSQVASSANGSKLYACEDDGDIYCSADSGVTWTPSAILGSSGKWSSIACSADGSMLIACKDAGLYTSSDSGTTWTERQIYINHWTGVASSSDGSKLVACANAGLLYTSADGGTTWTPRLADTNRNWAAVASSADGSKLFAFNNAPDTGGHLYVSADAGATWTDHSSVYMGKTISCSADGNQLAIGTASYIYTNITSGNYDLLCPWETTGSTGNWTSIASSVDGFFLVATGDGGIHTYFPQISSTGGIAPPQAFITGKQYEQAELQYLGDDKFLVQRHGGDQIVPIHKTLDVSAGTLKLAQKTPASATAPGVAGEICWDADYLYICVAANSWKRVALAGGW